jgi:HTH-type transcriptional regulator, sugar sensing transcriptional regulator
MTQEVLGELQDLGFGEYEARAYVSLLRRGALTGYQLAKVSGIPRPNIYPVLNRLEERGAVSRMTVEGGVRYVALPAEEMLSRLGREASLRLEKAREAMRGIEASPETPQVWNLEGYDVMLGRAREIIESAQEQLLVGIWADESRHLADAIAAAESRGVALTTLCIQGCPDECGGCRGDVFRYPLAADADKRWLVVAADERELLVGQVAPDGTAIAAVTRLEAFVAVGTHYLRNGVAAAEIVRSLGRRITEVLDDQALEALGSAGLATGGLSWLDRMLAASEATR